MTTYLRTLLILLFLSPAWQSPADAQVDAGTQRRVALVIGNSSYESITRLTNPRNDANAVAKSLEPIGFETTLALDSDYENLKMTIDGFLEKAKGADAVVVYYAGHGVQIGPHNHILPIDFTIEDLESDYIRSINLTTLLRQLEDASPVRILFLDACRNDPTDTSDASLTRQMRSVNLKRAAKVVRSGFTEMSAAVGTFIAFATGRGETALDGTGDNSPFTLALLRHLDKPGVSLNEMIMEVRREVVSETAKLSDSNGRPQVPWTTSSLLEEFYFVERMKFTEVARQLQEHLKSMNCYRGPVDGNWGAGSRAAILAFNNAGNENVDVAQPGQSALGVLRRHARELKTACSSVAVEDARASSYSANGNAVRKTARPSKPRPATVYNKPTSKPSSVPWTSGVGVGAGGF